MFLLGKNVDSAVHASLSPDKWDISNQISEKCDAAVCCRAVSFYFHLFSISQEK
jgi:hypothetical protein